MKQGTGNREQGTGNRKALVEFCGVLAFAFFAKARTPRMWIETGKRRASYCTSVTWPFLKMTFIPL